MKKYIIPSEYTDYRPIAIIGSGCVLPPDAFDTKKFWENVLNGRSGICQIPEDRWDYNLYYDPKPSTPCKTYCTYAGFIKDYKFPWVDKFPKDTLDGLNRSQQIILDTIVQATNESNVQWDSMKPNRVGFCLANMLGDEFMSGLSLRVHTHEFIHFLNKSQPFENLTEENRKQIETDFIQAFEDRFPGLRPGHYQKAFGSTLLTAALAAIGIRSHNWIVDAACASSLFAFDSAIKALSTNTLDCVAVISLFSNMMPPGHVSFSRIGGLSLEGGWISPMDSRAKGLLSGEGSTCYVLKRLDDAIDNKDKILGIIRGMGFSCDGSGKAIFAPDKSGQQRAMQNALISAGITPESISYLETHATSTKIGDVEELQAIQTVFASKFEIKEKLTVGSCKSLFGHTFSNAGSVNILKILKGFEHETIAPTYQFKEFPTHPNLKKDHFEVVTKKRRYARRLKNMPYRAMVNAFGFGGVNGSVILEEYRRKYHNDLVNKLNLPPYPSRTIDVAVVGVGCVNADANNLSEFRKTFQNPATYRTTYPERRWGAECATLFGEMVGQPFKISPIDDLNFNAMQFKILPTNVDAIDRSQQIMLMVCRDALDDFGNKDSVDPEKIGLYVGSMFGLEYAFTAGNRIQRAEYYDVFRKLPVVQEKLTTKEVTSIVDDVEAQIFPYVPPTKEETLPGMMDNIVAGRVGKKLDIQGMNVVVDMGAASFHASLDIAIQSLRRNEHDLLIVGGVHSNLLPEFISVFDDYCQHTSNKACPHCGCELSQLVPAEGGVAFVLKRYEDVKEGETIYARIQGIEHGVGSSAHKSGHPSSQCCKAHAEGSDIPFYFGAQGGFSLLSNILKTREVSTAEDAKTTNQIELIGNSLFSDCHYSIVLKPSMMATEIRAEKVDLPQPPPATDHSRTVGTQDTMAGPNIFLFGAASRKDLLRSLENLIQQGTQVDIRSMTEDEVLIHSHRVAVVHADKKELVNKLTLFVKNQAKKM